MLLMDAPYWLNLCPSCREGQDATKARMPHVTIALTSQDMEQMIEDLINALLMDSKASGRSGLEIE